MEDRKTTCAVLYKYEDTYLICHATLSRYWTLPKGIKDENETTAEAAIREMEEETGIKLDKEKLVYIGKFPYLKDKDIVLFKYKAEEIPDIKKLKCTTYFETADGRKLPEVDHFTMATKKELKQKLNKNLYNIVKKVI